MLGALLVARARKLCWNPSRPDRISQLQFARVRKLCRNLMDTDIQSLLESLGCIKILACEDSHDILPQSG
jgi:hypothetical protein